MTQLYPLKFKPQYMEKLWGGRKIEHILGRDLGVLSNCGESWEISGVQGYVSEVSNGFLIGNELNELLEVYMGDLVGDRVFDRFGQEFPLLIKLIDADDDLSVQVHPDDALAMERHNSSGKTEMWYVLQADAGARINCGFKRPLNAAQYQEMLDAGRLPEILNFESAKSGDVFFMPAGRVHAIGRGILLAEIQQTSDVTYRIFDYNRTDSTGQPRELHTDMALDAIDFTFHDNYRTDYTLLNNKAANVVSCDYFRTGILQLDRAVARDIYEADSFIIYIAVEGSSEISWDGGRDVIRYGETVLVPAALHNFGLRPLQASAKLLEITAG
ncbi:MAG: class I mannose-6-phosphate isomerase [Bacteroidales bacterium]|jgi:mannose-6-phosphate isomerase|nr:class I mannose-6-phosphate isomerase [Bacteroidales bacterium]